MANTTHVAEPLRAVAIAWSGMDLTDFAAPCEVLSHARNASGERLVSLTVASDDEVSLTSQGVKISRDTDTETLLKQLATVDLLIVPGGGGFSAASVPAAPGLKTVLKDFASLPPRVDSPDKGPRVIMSICAGAFFLAEAGLLAGKVATAHYASLGEIQKLANVHGKDTRIVRQHYVDQGVDKAKNLQTITGGGIMSGFDASFYFLEIKLGLEMAHKARDVMDSSWRREMTPFGFVA